MPARLVGVEKQSARRPSQVPVLRLPLTGGRPLEPATRTRLEPYLGQSLAALRVHDDAAAAGAADALGARAFAHGDQLVFGAGEYRPRARDGQRLLAHEVAHAAHARAAGAPLPGVAPAAATGERAAEAFASAAVEGTPELAVPDFRSWGPAWQLQLQRVITAGHVEDFGAIYEGHTAPRDFVEARSDVEVELDQFGDLANEFSIGVRGPDAPSVKFLQFYWIELYATMPKGKLLQLEGPITTTTAKNLELTRKAASPVWALDSDSPTPYYDPDGPAIRSKTTATMFDAPGGNAEDFMRGYLRIRDPGTPHTLVFHLDTYLVEGTRAVYHVAWMSTTTYTRDAHNNITTGKRRYPIVNSGPVNALPENLSKLLASKYPAYRHVGEPPKRPRRRPPHIAFPHLFMR